MPQDSVGQGSYNKLHKGKRLSGLSSPKVDTDSLGFIQSAHFNEVEGDSILPPAFKQRLQDLFLEIEKEFEALYIENLNLQDKCDKMNKKLNGDCNTNVIPNENTDTDSLANSFRFGKQKVSLGSQQKLKTAHKQLKAQTIKMVSSFKTPPLSCTLVRSFSGHRDGVWDVATTCTSQPLIATASADHTARIWSTETGYSLLQYTGHTGSVNSIKFHPTKDLALTASGDQTAHIWQAAVNWEHFVKINSSEEELDEVKDDDVEGGGISSLRTPIRSLTGHSNVVMAADWLPLGDQVITASWDRTASIYDVETGEMLHSLSGHDQELMHASAHHSQKLVVTSSRDTTFRLWDFREPIHSVSVFQGHTQTVTCTIFAKSSDEKIVSGSDDRTVKVWDLRNMRSSLATIRSDSGINRLAISPTGIIAIPHDNRQVRLFDLQGQRIARLPRTSRQGHRRMVCGVAWKEDGNGSCNFFSCGFDRLILGWLIQSNKD